MLVACSTDLDTSALFLSERSQNDLSYIYRQSQEQYLELERKALDESAGDRAISRMKKDFVKVQSLDQDIWTAIEDLEEVKADLIAEWTGKEAIALMTEEFGGKSESIQIYDLSNSDNSVTSNYSFDSEKGKIVESTLTDLRKNLTEKLAATSNYGKKKYVFKDNGISDFKDLKDLRKKVESLVKASNVALDDEATIIQVYCDLSLSKKEWSQLLPEETTFLNVFRMICHLEKEILKVRHAVFSLINTRYIGCSFGFDKILSVASGKNIVSAGDTVEIQVTMAAFNSYSEPIVKCTKGKAIKSSVRNGMGTITFIAPEKGEQKVTYSGTITVKNKSGVPKTVKWEKEVWVKE